MTIDPFSILLNSEREARRSALSYPVTRPPEVLFTGIGFSLRGYLLAVSIDTVCEVMPYPRITPIPGIKDWVCGIAAIRGQVLPVVELATALGGCTNAFNEKSKVLSLKYRETIIGVVVDEVFGSRRFLFGEKIDPGLTDKNWISPYLEGAFLQKKQVWNILSVAALEKSGVLSSV
nr:purine-binding chemotaxis protein CheW [Gammaproteobacteria bacterium]